jgi:hypothetical protein
VLDGVRVSSAQVDTLRVDYKPRELKAIRERFERISACLLTSL